MKLSNIEFHGNPSSGSHVDTYGQRDRLKDMTKLIGIFRYYAKAHEVNNVCVL